MSGLSVKDINKILTNKLRGKKFEFVSYEQVDLNSSSIGFLSYQEKVCIKYCVNDYIKELYLFIKKLPVSSYHNDLVTSMGAFEKEVVVFNKFLIEIKKKYISNPIPTCYLAKPDILVFRDLSFAGFRNLPLHETFDLAHCKRVIEALAKVHLSSIVFEIKNCQKLSEYIAELKEETFFAENGKDSPSINSVFAGINSLRAFTMKYIPHRHKNIEDKVFDFMLNMRDHLAPSSKYLNVLTHGDLWINNLMFKYDDRGVPVEACVVDFQLATYKPLTFDLQMFIYCCTSKSLREKHYNSLKKYYYDSLLKEASIEKIDLLKLLPWSDFEGVHNETLPVAIARSALGCAFVLIPEFIMHEVMKTDELWKKFFEDDRNDEVLRAAEISSEYKNRVLDLLNDLFECFSST